MNRREREAEARETDEAAGAVLKVFRRVFLVLLFVSLSALAGICFCYLLGFFAH